MEELAKAIETERGIIRGRDAIYLDEVKVINEFTFFLKGVISGPREWRYSITFNDVHLFKMIELDFDSTPYASSFDEIVGSLLLKSLIQRDNEMHIRKIDKSYKHFVFRTYDTVFEIICKGYQLTID